MVMGRRMLVWLAAALALKGCGSSLESDPGRSAAEREQAAEARVKKDGAAWTEYQRIRKDPAAAAMAAADDGDFRFAAFAVYSMARASEHESPFPGVECSAPATAALTRVRWSVTISDVPLEYEPARPEYSGGVARAYNVALLGHPHFPYGDICQAERPRGAETERTADERPAYYGAVDTPVGLAWERIADRRARGDPAQALSLAVRNGAPLPASSGPDVDATDEFGMTALGWAATRSPVETVRRLMDMGADPWFGDYCSVRMEGGARLRNVQFSPIALAVVHGREDVVEAMLRRAPRKECAGNAELRESALRERLRVIRFILPMARHRGMEKLARHMLTDFLDTMPRFPDDSYARYAYGDISEAAWENGLSDIYRDRPDAEILRSQDFIRDMAANADPAELAYWIKRLNLSDAKDIRTILSAIPCAECHSGKAPDFAAKFNHIVDLTPHYDAAEKDYILDDLLVEGRWGAKHGSPWAVRTMLSAFRRNGYDLGTARFLTGRCSLLMVALSHSEEECSSRSTLPILAEELLRAGVDPNEGRTKSGLSALDIVRRRTANGPDAGAFRAVEALMLAKGAR